MKPIYIIAIIFMILTVFFSVTNSNFIILMGFLDTIVFFSVLDEVSK
jgi:hypothetical protein